MVDTFVDRAESDQLGYEDTICWLLRDIAPYIWVVDNFEPKIVTFIKRLIKILPTVDTYSHVQIVHFTDLNWCSLVP